MNIGFIGLGIMGRPMAANLLNAGHTLWVHARRPAMMKELTDLGATACDTSKEVASNSDIIFICVSDSHDVDHVILGNNGVIEGASKDNIVVDMSTISPSVTRSIATTLKNKNIHMLDAPVSGGEQGAISGTLSIMVGGNKNIFERVVPLFEVMGKNIVHIGDNGAGQVAKACNQVLIAQTISAIGEAFILASASGVDPVKVRQALMGGFAGSRALESHGQRMLDRNFKPGFKARLHQKDMRIAMEAAYELGIALPGAAMVSSYLNAVVGHGNGDNDSISILELQEQLSGITVNKHEK
ncbi:MAG: 2-hydroxy-3-oxopropionate reductase [Gammaproteobacteria bacterium]|nr:2-hydroxy-3-oxopropionate reductase [Gammaproteobacteria bacterium]